MSAAETPIELISNLDKDDNQHRMNARYLDDTKQNTSYLVEILSNREICWTTKLLQSKHKRRMTEMMDTRPTIVIKQGYTIPFASRSNLIMS